MRSSVLGKFIRIAIISAVGMTFLMTIICCRSSEVIIRTGPDVRANKEAPPPPQKNGPPPWAPAHGHRAKYRYRYYPNSQVYFNENRGNYIYYRNGNWEVSVSLPDRIRIEVNDYVTLEMDTDQPYRYHDDVNRKYPPGQMKKDKDKGKGKDKW